MSRFDPLTQYNWPADLTTSHLRAPLQQLRSDAREALLRQLRELGGSVVIVADEHLIDALFLLLARPRPKKLGEDEPPTGTRELREIANVQAIVPLKVFSGTASFDEVSGSPHAAAARAAVARLDGECQACSSLLMIARSTISSASAFGAFLKALRASSWLREAERTARFQLSFSPSRPVACEQALVDDHVWDMVRDNMGADLPLGAVPLDTDLVSLREPTLFNDLFVRGDLAALHPVVDAVERLQRSMGRFRAIHAVGEVSVRLAQLLSQRAAAQAREDDGLAGTAGAAAAAAATGAAGQFRATLSGGAADTLVLVDRLADPVSPLITPLTVEALLHEEAPLKDAAATGDPELLAIDHAACRIPFGGITPGSNPPLISAVPMRTVALTSSDEVWEQVRGESISSAGTVVRRIAEETLEFEQQKATLKAAEVEAIRSYVSRLGSLPLRKKGLRRATELVRRCQATTNSPEFEARWQWEHATLTDHGRDTLKFIQDHIARRAPLADVLRCLALVSVTGGGVAPRSLDLLRRSILAVYGLQHVPTLLNLQRCGLLRRGRAGVFSTGAAAADFDWRAVRDGARLQVDRVDTERPTDTAYVTSGVAPLSSRIAERVLTGGIDPLRSREGAIPGFPVAVAHLVQFDAFGKGPEARPAMMLASQAVQRVAAALGEAAGRALAAGATDAGREEGAEAEARRVAVMAFIGGVTPMEMAAIRFLNAKPGFGWHIVVLATDVVSGKELIESIAEPIFGMPEPAAGEVAAAGAGGGGGEQ